MGIISRAGTTVVLFLVVTFMLYMLLLGAGASRAQEPTMMDETTSGTTGGTTAQPDEGCENPEEVATFEGTETQRTEQFTITGDTIRINFETSVTDPDAVDDNLTITLLDDAGEFEDSVLVLEPENGSENLLAGPGEFSLELDSEDVSYTVTVEDCVGTSDNGNSDDNNNGNDNDGDDEDTDNDGVIDDTIPDKDLPDTGGSAALIVGGSTLLLLYGGLVAWRLKSREQ